MSLIKDTHLHTNRIALYSYISMCKGLNHRLLFSVPKFLKWAGFQSDSHTGGINDKVLMTLNELRDRGCISYRDSPSRTATFELNVDVQVCYDMNGTDFALLYIDEIERIVNYERNNIKDSHLNSYAILLVFACIRRKIWRRPNELKPEEQTLEGIEARKDRVIEAYNATYKEIAFELGLSDRTVSEAVRILIQLKLIVIREAFHIRDDDGNYHTPDIIFANYEKREDKYLLDYGINYAYGEIERKAKQIDKYSVKGYKLKAV